MGESRKQAEVLDGVLIVGALVAGTVVAVFPVFVVPRFVEMFRDFGGPLPLVTKVAISPPFSWGSLGLILLSSAAGVGLVVGGHRGSGRLSLLLALAMAMLVCAFVVTGLYLPVFQMAGAVR